MIDLHTHSTASDGTCSPRELTALAAEKGISALALTDHDTLDGLEEAQNAAAELGIRFIPGIELEIFHHPGDFHLLGLGINDWRNSSLDAFLKEVRQHRNDRNSRMIELIRDEGIDITEDDLNNAAGGRIIARPHFAKVLVEKKIAKSIKHAFDKFLGVGQRFYLPKVVMNIEKGIELIHEAGGSAVIAHPLSLYLSWGKLPERLMEWKLLGLDGIEAWHSGATVNQALRFERIAADCGLFVTGGSDFHGTNRKDRSLGLGAGNKPVSDDLLNSIL